MSIRALPLLVVPLIVYNIVVVFAGGGPATGPLAATVFKLPMLSGATWDVHLGRPDHPHHPAACCSPSS